MKKTLGILSSLLLVVLMVIAFTGCIHISSDDIMGEYKYAYGDKYTKYTEQVSFDPFADISMLDINWIGGEINVIAGDRISIEEESIKGDYYPLYYRVNEDALVIQYCESGTSSKDISKTAKKLVVTIPSTIKDVNIDDVSASVNIDVDTLRELEIDDVSGKIDVKASMVDDLDIDAVSCNIDVAVAKAGKIEVDTVSGSADITIDSSMDLSSIKADSVSGNINLYLDGVRGYRLVFESISGKKDAEFVDGSDASLPRFDIKVETVSGNLNIKKNR
jgi:DUF4097 and DUF4098 domain-containing protein YvlB